MDRVERTVQLIAKTAVHNILSRPATDTEIIWTGYRMAAELICRQCDKEYYLLEYDEIAENDLAAGNCSDTVSKVDIDIAQDELTDAIATLANPDEIRLYNSILNSLAQTWEPLKFRNYIA